MPLNNLLFAASFNPISIQAPSAWVGRLPFAAWVINEVKPNIFVELGTHSGNSYFSFCHHALNVGPNPGPHEAIADFIEKNQEFYIDREKEAFLITWNPKGYLKRER